MPTKKENLKKARESSRTAMAALRERRKAEGLCLWCGDPTIGFSQCEECRKRGNVRKMLVGRDKYREEKGGVRLYRCAICGGDGHNRKTCQTRQDISQQLASEQEPPSS